MIKPDMIPVEASWAILKTWNGCECEVCCAVAIAAALNAWPGMDTRPNIYGRQDAILVLPLPQENTDD